MPGPSSFEPFKGGRKVGSSLWKGIRKHKQLYWIAAFPLIFLIIFNYIPMLGVQIAFREFIPSKGMWGSPWVGMKYVESFLQSPYFWPIIKNTLAISFYQLAVATPAAVILAFMINEVKHQRFKKTVQMATYAPYFISTVVLVGIMEIILSPNSGLLGQIAAFIGIESPDLLGSAAAFPSLFVWSTIWQETGYSAVIYLAALSGVNPELYEAARLDGASRLRKIVHIDLPAIIPTIVVLFVLGIGGLLGLGFEKTYLLQNSTNLSASEIIATYVYKVGLVDSNFSFSVAVGLFNSVVSLFLILIVNYGARKATGASLF
jgi:putative aldouronate transport system permease protein